MMQSVRRCSRTVSKPRHVVSRSVMPSDFIACRWSSRHLEWSEILVHPTYICRDTPVSVSEDVSEDDDVLTHARKMFGCCRREL
jgi:hypothetical protein